MQKQKKFTLLIFALTLSLDFAFAQDTYAYAETWTKLRKLDWFYLTEAQKNAKEVIQDNEFDRNTAGQLIYFYSNPLLLDGKQVDYGKFTLFSEGILTVVRGNPEKKEAIPIPFYVYLRRDGKIVENKKMLFANKSLKKINLAEIFAFARYGDLLIIKPVRAEDWRAKRILKLIGGGC